MRSNAWCARIEIAIDRRDSAAAISYGELGVEANRAWLRSADDKKTARCELVRILGNYAAALIQAKRIGQAETVTREALSLLEVVKSTPQTRSFAAIHWNNLGVIERWQQRFHAAAEAELRAVTIQEELLATSPRTVGLQFQTGRSHFRYALSLGRQGKDATKAQRHLQRARSLLGELCRRPNATWAQHCCLTNVMAEFGRIAWSRGAFRDAHEAFDATIRSSEAAEAIAPDHPELRTVRRDAWLRRTNLALSLKIGDGPAQARSFAAEFPGEPEVACHVTSMFCNLAKETLQGDDAGRVELAGDYRSEALDHLKKAVDAGALDHHTITTHRAWKPLHGHPRFDALVQRTK